MSPRLVLVSSLLLGAATGCDCRTPPPTDGPRQPTTSSTQTGLDAHRQAVLTALEEEGDAAAAARIEAVDDPVGQVALVTALADGGLDFTRPFCDQLSDGPARDRCVRFAKRPHLTNEGLSTPIRTRDRSAPGPPAGRIAPKETVDPSFTGDHPIQTECPGDHPERCYATLARSAAGAGRSREAAALCAEIEAERWQEECAFQAAESAAERGGGAAQRAMAELCLLSGDFQARCLNHGVRRLALSAPHANAPPTAWETISETATSMQDFWADRDPVFGQWQQQRLWSYALMHAYAWAPEVSGAPLAALPPDARPHIHGAAAGRWLKTDAPKTDDLDTLADAFDAVLARPDGAAPSDQRKRAVLPPNPRWNRDHTPEEADIPVVFHLGSSRRAVAEDPDVDRMIALVEAIARHEEPGWSARRTRLLEQAGEHSDPRVSHTARRVAQWFLPRGRGAPGAGTSSGLAPDGDEL